IPEAGQVRHLGAAPDLLLLDIAEGAVLRTVGESGAGPEPCEGPHGRVIAQPRAEHHREGDLAVVADPGIDDPRGRPDPASRAHARLALEERQRMDHRLATD